MKKLLLCAAFIAASFTGIAQVGVGTTNPNASAALEVKSITKGFLPPRMTTADRDLINTGTPAEGLTIYNTDTKCLELYNGTNWISVCDGSVVTTMPIITTQVANGTGGTYTFMSHNLGADTSLDPDIPVFGLQGAYIQWGKRGPTDFVGAANDGSSGFAAAPTMSDANAAAVTDWSSTPAVDGAWNVDENTPVKVTDNDPCPDGFRVPTRNEWVAVDTYNADNLTGATWSAGPTEFGTALQYGPDANGKLLTLPAAGSRNSTNGALITRGNNGDYWSSTENGDNAYSLYFGSSSVAPAEFSNRTNGLSVRCIAE
jgi:uncharacterized protein (TIGR02145 family)